MRNNPLQNEKGLASIEATVLSVLFVSLLYYTFGFFGVVHTAILHNIHSRTYAFETFRHRANLMYFRSNNGTVLHYYDINSRLHGVNTDSRRSASRQVATERPIIMGQEVGEQSRQSSVHNRDIYNRVQTGDRNQAVSVHPVWVMTMYGICLNLQCGG